jgi:hypothetical protein
MKIEAAHPERGRGSAAMSAQLWTDAHTRMALAMLPDEQRHVVRRLAELDAAFWALRAEDGGWTRKRRAVLRGVRILAARRAVERLSADVDFWVTLRSAPAWCVRLARWTLAAALLASSAAAQVT